MNTTVLHIALENCAGVPYSLVRAERMAGLNSIFFTLSPPLQDREFDTPLSLPFYGGFLPRILRRLGKSMGETTNRRYYGQERPPLWKPTKWARKLFALRDYLWENILVRRGIDKVVESADIIALDGGTDFVRSSKFVLPWAEKHNNRVAVFYYGEDLRRRGAIEEIEKIAPLVFTFEFDHTLIHPRAKFLFYPFFIEDIPERKIIGDGKIRIGHSPTNRKAKGTDRIVDAIRKISKKFRNVEIVLIEKLSYRDALEKKSTLDIFIDQIGELGYGISGLESLAMGIPTAVQIMPDFEKFLGEHPFVLVDDKIIEEVLACLVKNPDMREEYGRKGKSWVAKVHSPIGVAQKVIAEYQRLGWL